MRGGGGRELGEIWVCLGAHGLVWVGECEEMSVSVCEGTYRDDMSEKTSSLRTGDLVVVRHQVREEAGRVRVVSVSECGDTSQVVSLGCESASEMVRMRTLRVRE